jgi:hypothetical protein
VPALARHQQRRRKVACQEDRRVALGSQYLLDLVERRDGGAKPREPFDRRSTDSLRVDVT